MLVGSPQNTLGFSINVTFQHSTVLKIHSRVFGKIEKTQSPAKVSVAVGSTASGPSAQEDTEDCTLHQVSSEGTSEVFLLGAKTVLVASKSMAVVEMSVLLGCAAVWVTEQCFDMDVV